MKFHINTETGNPNKCVAKPGNCRFGSDDEHYGTKEDARAAYEAKMTGQVVSPISKLKVRKPTSASAIAANKAILEGLVKNQKDQKLRIGRTYHAGKKDTEEAIDILARHGNTKTIQEIFRSEGIDPTSYKLRRSDLPLTLIKAHALWVDTKTFADRPDNLLNPDARSTESTDEGRQDRYDRDIAAIVAAEGSAVDIKDDYYGWHDFNAKDEPIVAAFDLDEDHWNEFNGTFNEDDDSHSGYSMTVLTESGEFRKLRYEANIGEIMRQVEFREAVKTEVEKALRERN